MDVSSRTLGRVVCDPELKVSRGGDPYGQENICNLPACLPSAVSMLKKAHNLSINQAEWEHVDHFEVLPATVKGEFGVDLVKRSSLLEFSLESQFLSYAANFARSL